MHHNISKYAVLSLVFAFILPVAVLYASLWSPVIGIPLAVALALSPPAAVLLAHLSLRQIRQSMGKTTGMRLAEISLLFGYAETALLAIALALFRPEDRKQAYAASAVGSLRKLDEATRAYAKAHPAAGFPVNLAVLSGEIKGDDYDSSAVRSLASGERGCYRFAYSARSTHGNGQIDAFGVTADPVCPGTSYLRHFYMDQSGVIRNTTGAQANAQSAPLD